MILVTGASGFIGSALVRALARDGHKVRAASRRRILWPEGVEPVVLPDLYEPYDWAPTVAGVEAVIHLAGIAHTGAQVPEARYEQVNRDATVSLASASQRAGVQHFVFLSSIRAQSGPTADHVLTEQDRPRPEDAYGRSKLAAEVALEDLAIPYTVLRPVLVYGPGVKGNMASLLKLAKLSLPLPFADLASRRSLLALDNLIEAIRFVLSQPVTRGETYIVADPLPALTLAEIISALRAGLGRNPGLVPIPPAALRLVLSAVGRKGLWDRLGGELVADPAKLSAAGWSPPLASRDGLMALAQAASPLKSGTASRSTR